MISGDLKQEDDLRVLDYDKVLKILEEDPANGLAFF